MIITFVFQDAYLFQQDFLSNITLHNKYPETKVSSVIRKLQLEKLMERWKGQVLDADSIQTLSGGEKQRTALARALLRETPFYLLDEVTASVDHETRDIIEEMLLSSDFGFLFVSHNPKLENLSRYDQIILLEDGSIKEIGSYEKMKDKF